jgi:hypothetical protein
LLNIKGNQRQVLARIGTLHAMIITYNINCTR